MLSRMHSWRSGAVEFVLSSRFWRGWMQHATSGVPSTSPHGTEDQSPWRLPSLGGFRRDNWKIAVVARTRPLCSFRYVTYDDAKVVDDEGDVLAVPPVILVLHAKTVLGPSSFVLYESKSLVCLASSVFQHSRHTLHRAGVDAYWLTSVNGIPVELITVTRSAGGPL